MIVLLGASAIHLMGLQASLAAPTQAFRGCLKEAAAKAMNEKVSADTIDTYLRGACTVQMGALKDALVAFSMKNGDAKKAAVEAADMTVDDYVSTPAETYKYMSNLNAPKAPVVPAAQPDANTQSPKP